MDDKLRFHAMKDDRRGSVTVVACRASREAANLEASRAEREGDRHDADRPVVTWVDPASNCGHP